MKVARRQMFSISGNRGLAVISTARGEIFEVRSVPIKDDAGTVTRLINLTRNITKTRKAEEELRSLMLNWHRCLLQYHLF